MTDAIDNLDKPLDRVGYLVCSKCGRRRTTIYYDAGEPCDPFAARCQGILQPELLA